MFKTFFTNLANLLGLGRKTPPPTPSLPPVRRDVAYGPDPMHRMDVYHPPVTPNGILILMVHGGGWWQGDKRYPNVVANKLAHYLPLGYTFASMNYRMVPKVDPVMQTEDVARALAFAQVQARAWGINATRVVLMGHSAGGHLVALLASAPDIAKRYKARPWLGTIGLDTAAYDVEQIMAHRHPSIYDDAFGDDPDFWRAASPIYRLDRAPHPMLLVAGTTGGEETERYENVVAFADKVTKLKGRAEVLPVKLAHGDCNGELGLPGEYTDKVDAFLRSLVPDSRV